MIYGSLATLVENRIAKDQHMNPCTWNNLKCVYDIPRRAIDSLENESRRASGWTISLSWLSLRRTTFMSTYRFTLKVQVPVNEDVVSRHHSGTSSANSLKPASTSA
mmetsp:Transcript_18017/g.34834  ORF Transcript_18017/g.34834 Transcript_18017/m.34834 type:complete len:106 (+) Transcript_18017:58-375(+)